MDLRIVTVILPCLNESATLRSMVGQIRSISEQLKIIVVDNGSTDDTYTIAKSLGVNVVREVKRGKGFAVKRGFLSLNSDCEIVFLVDISGSMVTEKVSCTGLDRFRTTQWLTNSILDQLISDHQVGIGTIGGDCQTPPAAWKKVGSTSIKDIQSTISGILPEGSTPLARMLALSPDLFSNNSKSQKSLIVISDGANTCPHPQQPICASAEILADKNIKVHILSFLQNTVSHAAAFADYECLTETTSGKLLYLEDNQCQMNAISYDLIQACSLKLPPFEKSNCLGASIPNLWMFYKADLFIEKNKNNKE